LLPNAVSALTVVRLYYLEAIRVILSHKHPFIVNMLGISRTSSRSSQDAPAPRQKTRQVWTPDEDQKLSEAVAKGE
jgi:hypothetical protein